MFANVTKYCSVRKVISVFAFSLCLSLLILCITYEKLPKWSNIKPGQEYSQDMKMFHHPYINQTEFQHLNRDRQWHFSTGTSKPLITNTSRGLNQVNKANSLKMLNDTYIDIHSEEDEKENKTETKKIKIVVYFPHQGRISGEINRIKMNKCKDKNCRIQQVFVEISGTIVDADAIVFQGNYMPKHFPVQRDTNQVFVFLNNEPPMYIQNTNLKSKAFIHFFNWTMTYRTDSDIPLLYGEIFHKEYDKDENKIVAKQIAEDRNKGDDLVVDEKNYTSIFRQKDKNAFWIVSHCTTKSKREKYLSKMKNYTQIDQFGSCNSKSLPRKMKIYDTMGKQYKFYLAFENTLCTDYLTEKVFNWFAYDLVLVVRGGCNYAKFLPEGTYIDANEFKTPKDLALFLTDLGRNEEEYIGFLRRKEKYFVVKEDQNAQKAFCNLCNKLNHVNENRKSVDNIYKWWQLDMCWKPNDF